MLLFNDLSANKHSICLEFPKELLDREVEDYNIVAFSVDPSEYFANFEIPDESKWHLVPD